MRAFGSLLSVLSLTVLACGAVAEEPLVSRQAHAAFSVEQGAAVYDPEASALIFIEERAGALIETKRFAVKDSVWGVARLPRGYAVATGYGRGSLDVPLRLIWFSDDGTTSRVVFEKPGERTQTTQLELDGDKLWITFFDSKYITKTGYFVPGDAPEWAFTEKLSLRLGDAVDVAGDALAVGRPYGDELGQDGDLTVYLGSDRLAVPTYRGVRAVRFLGDTPGLELVAADGWHQNYAKFAQARLTYAVRDGRTGRFAAQLVDHDPEQYGFSKLIEFRIAGARYIAALGNKSLSVYSPTDNWKKRSVYTRADETAMFDVAFMGTSEGTAQFLVVDRGVKVVPFAASGL